MLKLIAYRPKDQIDLVALAALPRVDWSYVERWANEWEVASRLRQIRSLLDDLSA